VITCHEAPDVGELIGTVPYRAHLELGAVTSAPMTARTWAQVILGGWGLARPAHVGMIISGACHQRWSCTVKPDAEIGNDDADA
jgi:hypothetical protein